MQDRMACCTARPALLYRTAPPCCTAPALLYRPRLALLYRTAVRYNDWNNPV